MRIAINQPYFIPYAGYFRLFEADVFVYLDDCQFPYPGYVHRNKLTTHAGSVEWLTIPLKDMPLKTKIKDMEFADKAGELWEKQIRRFKVFDNPTMLGIAVGMVTQFISPVRAIESILELIKDKLNYTRPFYHSSNLNIFSDLKGQDRVLAICEYFKATEYINASGGKDLYDADVFRKHGIELKILKPYQGNMISILERLTYEQPEEILKEIQANVEFI